MKLTIGVVTMNRAMQLKEALESCLACTLPEETEFVIIDNASTDDTEQTVKSLLTNCGYPFYYEKLPENLGVGGGRNYAFTKAKGTYVYALDDDAVIDTERNPDFFIKATDLMDKNPDIITLTTQIYDTAWKANRVEKNGRQVGENLYLCKMFCGGSHFLRKSFFKTVPYLPNKYGYEEIPPSLRVVDAGKQNVFCADLFAIHKPAVNKWNWADERNHNLLINDCAIPYAIKKMMYPRVFRLLLRLALFLRCRKHLGQVPGGKKRVKMAIREMYDTYTISEKVKAKTVLRMAKDFGFSVF